MSGRTRLRGAAFNAMVKRARDGKFARSSGGNLSLRRLAHRRASEPVKKSGDTLNAMPDGVREQLSTGKRVGSPASAKNLVQALADVDMGGPDPSDIGFEHVGSGSQREVWLDPPGTVYKLGDDSANRQEARTMAKLRAEGAEYAPDVTLYEVEYEEFGPFGEGPEKRTRTVIAMPYLPEDGSVPHAGVVLPGAGDFNPDNVVSHGGKLWLVDAGGI